MSVARTTAVVVSVFALMALGVNGVQAAKCKAYVSVSDGTTSEAHAPAVVSGLTTCLVTASKTHSQSGAIAQTQAKVTYTQGRMTHLTGSVTETPTTMAGNTSHHSPSYAKAWDWDARLIGEGFLANCQLTIKNLHLVVPSFEPATTIDAQLVFEIEGIPTVMGNVTMSGDGTCVGDGIYTPNQFLVYADGPYWHAEYIGPASFPVAIPLDEYQVRFEVAIEDQPDLPRPVPMSFDPVHEVSLDIPDEYALVATGPGAVSQSLRVDRVGADELLLSWESSVCPGAENYGIYEGTIGDWGIHQAIDCIDDGGDLAETVIASDEDSYYMIVPWGGGFEGSYGTNTEEDERPAGGTRCETDQDLSCP